jgi:hypothetical protein
MSSQPYSDLSLPEHSVLLLERAEVPLPGQTLRTMLSALREAPVPPQRLARIAGYERERFAVRGKAPRLCAVLDPSGLEVRPRMWALGTWRLSRRILTEDARQPWEIEAALLALDLAAETYGRFASQLIELATQHAKRAGVGPVGGDAQELTAALRALRWTGASAATPLADQSAAERELRADPDFTPVEAYFGRTPLARSERIGELPGLRPAWPGEAGTPFAALVQRRARDAEAAWEALAFVEEWEVLARDLAGPPTDGDYAARYDCSPAVASARKQAFRQVFPGEDDPSRVVALLRRAAPEAGFARALSTPMVELAAAPQPERPRDRAAVQRRAPGAWAVVADDGSESVHRTKAAAVAEARLRIAALGGGRLRILDAADRPLEVVQVGEVALGEDARGEPVGAHVDALAQTPEGALVALERKSTEWDALPPDRVTSILSRHVSEALAAVRRASLPQPVRGVVVCYPRRPLTPGLAERLEALAHVVGGTIVWEDRAAPAASG